MKKVKNQAKTGFGEIFRSIFFSKWYITVGGIVLAAIAWICLKILSLG